MKKKTELKKVGASPEVAKDDMAGLNEIQQAAVIVAKSIMHRQQTMLGYSAVLSVFKYDATVRSIKDGTYGQCITGKGSDHECKKAVGHEALENLEVFCPDCLASQQEQKAFLSGLLDQLQTDLKIAKGAGISELRDNSHKLIGNHAFENSPTIVNQTLGVIVPNLENQIDALNELLAKVPFGKYGYCEECGHLIPIKRLKLRPLSKECVPCLAAIEKVSGGGKIKARI